MACLCEAVRFVTVFYKSNISRRQDRYVRLSSLSSEPARDSEREDVGNGRSLCLTLFVIFHHLTCASIVAVALKFGWLSSEGGGLAWELWALGQHLGLWTLFVQNLVRCWRCDALNDLS